MISQYQHEVVDVRAGGTRDEQGVRGRQRRVGIVVFERFFGVDPGKAHFFSGFAVRNAAGISLNLCAFITFFAVLTEAVKSALGALGIPATFSPFLAALLELASGIFSAPAVPTHFLLPFCAAACGWAGLSVHVQIFSVCEKLQMRCGKYLLAKGMQAALCFLFALIRQCFG